MPRGALPHTTREEERGHHLVREKGPIQGYRPAMEGDGLGEIATGNGHECSRHTTQETRFLAVMGGRQSSTHRQNGALGQEMRSHEHGQQGCRDKQPCRCQRHSHFLSHHAPLSFQCGFRRSGWRQAGSGRTALGLLTAHGRDLEGGPAAVMEQPLQNANGKGGTSDPSVPVSAPLTAFAGQRGPAYLRRPCQRRTGPLDPPSLQGTLA